MGAGADVVTKVGDFVTSVDFLSYMRSREIEVSVSGVRPSTRFWFFFDGQDVNQHVATGVVGVDANGKSKVNRSSNYGGSIITSDANGNLYAVFKIPDNTFYVGDRKLEIMDVPMLNSKDAATSYASSTYSGFNFSSAQTSLSSITRPPRFAIETSTVTTSTPRHRSDPLAQTFIIDSDQSSDTDMFVTKLDLYFAKKSVAGKGVGVQIREVSNGYPSGDAVPFSSVYLSASQVNASSTTASIATTITFEAPVALKVDTEYAIVIAPDGNDPDYLMWICRTGEKDFDNTNVTITQDTNAGVLFTSTNNKAWTPYQNENLKFTIYAAKFTSTSGSVALTNKGHEFFSVSNINGTFQGAEDVFTVSTSYASGTVSTTAGNNTIVGSGTFFPSQYAKDQHIIINNGTSYEALQISGLVSNTVMTTYGPAKNTSSNIAAHYKSPVGKLLYIDTKYPSRLILENSTAAAGFTFQGGSSIVGEISGAVAQLKNVADLPISYIQPMIYHTDFAKTRTSLTASKLYDGSSTTSRNLQFNSTNYMSDGQYYIRSKSNNPSSSDFTLTIGLNNIAANTTIDTSPVIDHDISSVMIGEYVVNAANTANDTIDSTELVGLGDARAKYVSRMVELADGLDAQSIHVILGAYKPPGTDIRVYARMQSSTDIRAFSDMEWTRLDIKPETNSVSSLANRYDYREFEYQPQTITSTAALVNAGGARDLNGTINYRDNTGALYNSYKYFAVKIVMLATDPSVVPRLKDLRVLALS